MRMQAATHIRGIGSPADVLPGPPSKGGASGLFEGPVVVAMVTVRVMQVSIDEIIDVVAVRDCFVSTARAVHVARLMAGTAVLRRTAIGVAVGYLDDVLVHVIAMGMVQVSIVQVIDVVAVADGGVSAAGAVLVVVMGMLRIGASGHGRRPPCAVMRMMCEP